jgi:hypothetical protein
MSLFYTSIFLSRFFDCILELFQKCCIFCNNVNKLLIYLTTTLLVGCLSGQYWFYLTTILLVGCLSGPTLLEQF